MCQILTLPQRQDAMAAAQEMRKAVMERAKAIGASESQRRHAVAVGLNVLMAGRSNAMAVAEANKTMRPSLNWCGQPSPGGAA